MSTNVLVVGGGGREHALAWKMAQSPRAGKIYAAPGNPGMAAMGVECLPYKATDIDGIAAYVGKNNIDLTVVGPEGPLDLGMVDVFTQRGFRTVGPTASAARLESDKAYAKRLMEDVVPAAPFEVFTEAADAHRYADGCLDKKKVVKASGLAEGKGVYVCDSGDEIHAAIDKIMVDKKHGAAGNVVIIEERLYGREVSAIAIANELGGIRFFPEAQDYKPVRDGDDGPNTGGMGSYSPVPFVTDKDRIAIQRAMKDTLMLMEQEGDTFSGVLYGGMMLTKDGPMVLEYNVRFGDPETQPLMMRTRSDLLTYLEECTDGMLSDMPELDIDPRAAVCVVLASRGYPDKPDTGHRITGIDDAKKILGPDGEVFHAGTKLVDWALVNSGGRVLGVTARGDTIDKAADLAYAAADVIKFDGKHNRTDIGRNVMERGRA